VAGHRYWFIDCKNCGGQIIVNDREEDLTCPLCGEASSYFGDDFKTAELF